MLLGTRYVPLSQAATAKLSSGEAATLKAPYAALNKNQKKKLRQKLKKQQQAKDGTVGAGADADGHDHDDEHGVCASVPATRIVLRARTLVCAVDRLR